LELSFRVISKISLKIHITYVRYADDFLICVCGSKEDARKVKEDIKIFLDYELCLELSDQKTVITRATDRAKFLGYEMSISCDNNCKKTKQGIRRVYNGGSQAIHAPQHCKE